MTETPANVAWKRSCRQVGVCAFVRVRVYPNRSPPHRVILPTSYHVSTCFFRADLCNSSQRRSTAVCACNRSSSLIAGADPHQFHRILRSPLISLLD
ncbi:hypothetical protein EGR_03280 [Echinococcus granulosus]|uniref:Uncharacterized protein n=1 Tax=Echinococcus granulosus TaxID=6210 RepID=W6V5U3_ECHGR|nr:hypothetical protein EGR_03280 [Echinococcus granulosus]EUB61734.1 hypothetical protein EGR_03280 [Echinococcus granulosus]